MTQGCALRQYLLIRFHVQGGPLGAPKQLQGPQSLSYLGVPVVKMILLLLLQALLQLEQQQALQQQQHQQQEETKKMQVHCLKAPGGPQEGPLLLQ